MTSAIVHPGDIEHTSGVTSTMQSEIDAHVALANPHPGKYDPIGEAVAQVLAHVAAVDPHINYINYPRLNAFTDGQHSPSSSVDPYFFRDLMITDRVAGTIDGTQAEPGPAIRRVTDSENNLEIVDGRLVCHGGKAVPDYDDPAIGEEQPIYRQPGRTIMWSMLSNNNTPNAMIGVYDSLPSGSNLTHGVQFGNGDALIYYRYSYSPYMLTLAGLSASTVYTFAIVEETAGCKVFAKGGAFTNWTLLCRDNSNSNYGCITAGLKDFDGWISSIRVIDLSEPFDDDYGIASSFLPGPRTAGDLFTHTADCIIEFTVPDLPSVGTLAIDFRRQDNNNKWQLSITGTDLNLIEVVASTPTTRGSTVTVGAGDRIHAVISGYTCLISVKNILSIYYGSAVNFASCTDGKVSSLGTGGVASNIIAWPYSAYGNGLVPTATRYVQIADIADPVDYGADPTGTVDSTDAIQAAVFGAYFTVFKTAGTYLTNRRIGLPDNRTVLGAVPNVILQKDSVYSSVFSNIQASGHFRTRNRNITLQNLTIDLNDMQGDNDKAQAALWSHLTFCNADYVTIKGLTVINGPANAYGIQFAECSNVVVTNYSYEGDKDGFHVSGGVSHLIVDGYTAVSGDDTFALLASEWTYCGPTANSIHDITIRNGISNCGMAPGFLVRFITGSWLPWESGNTYAIGHICTYGGRLYKRVTAGSSASTIPPTHPWGDLTYSDGIKWRWVGDGNHLFSNIYNVTIKDLTILDNRVMIRMVESTVDHHSEYPGTEGTSVLDSLITDLPDTIFTNQGGVFSNSQFSV